MYDSILGFVAQTQSDMSLTGLLFNNLTSLFITAASLIGMWKVFVKAGLAGWKCLVPFYSTYLMIKMAGKPPVWFVYLLIPFVNIYFIIVMVDAFAKNFGKSSLFTVGLLLLSPVFYLILGLGDAKYSGPNVADGSVKATA